MQSYHSSGGGAGGMLLQHSTHASGDAQQQQQQQQQLHARQQMQAERERGLWDMPFRQQAQQQQGQQQVSSPGQSHQSLAPQPSKPPMHSERSQMQQQQQLHVTSPPQQQQQLWSSNNGSSQQQAPQPHSRSSSNATPSSSPLASGFPRPQAAGDSPLGSFDEREYARRSQQSTQSNLLSGSSPHSEYRSVPPAAPGGPSAFTISPQPVRPTGISNGYSYAGSSPTLDTRTVLSGASNGSLSSTPSQSSFSLSNGNGALLSNGSSNGVVQSGQSGTSPSPSPDPFHSRAQDPARIQALIQVVHQLSESGVQQKFLSQIGIIWKQLWPQLFVKGILKELVDNAASAGLLVLSGPPGQQQVELTTSGTNMAKQWRATHHMQNMQQLQEMKETLQAQARLQQQQQQSQQLGFSSNSTASSNWQPTSFGSGAPSSTSTHSSPRNRESSNTFSFLIDSDHNLDSHAPQLAQHRAAGVMALNGTGGSTRSSHLTDDSSDLGLSVNTSQHGGPSILSTDDQDREDSELLLRSYYEDSMYQKSPQTAPTGSHTNGGGHQQQMQHTSQQHNSHYTSTHNMQPSGSQSALVGSVHAAPQSSPAAQPLLYHSHQTNNNRVQHTYHPINQRLEANFPGGQSQQSSSYGNSPSLGALGGGSSSGGYGNGSQNGSNSQQQQQQLLGAPPAPMTPSDLSALQLLPPLPTGLEEKSFRGEKLKHLKYIFHFRVHPCLNFLQKGYCAFDNKNECFDYHSLKTRRRIPRIYSFSNGIFWNYNACRCQAIEKDMRCEKGEACRYAHCKEEIAYHPSRYKTSHCSYPLRSDGSCSRFGLHCAFSHGDHDTRKAIVLKQGMPHKLVEPAMHILQEQQKLVAALTGLTLAELNGFSLSGHNNSMSFGANGGGNNSGVQTGQGIHHSSSLHNGMNNSGMQQSMANVPSGMGASNSNNGMSQWEQQLQQRNALHGALTNGSTVSSNGHINLHPSDSSLQFEGHMQRPSSGRAQSGSSLAGLSQNNNNVHSNDSSPGLSINSALSGDLPYGTAPSSPSHQSINLDPNFLASLDPNTYMCPPSDLASDREFYLYSYKVLPCRNQTLACAKGECPSYHYETKRRRNPRQFRYSYEACPAVKMPAEGGNSGGWRRPSSCRLGDRCSLSHTLLEAMYSPALYKTVMCTHFDEHDRSTWQRCPWKRACAHAHSRLELEYSVAASTSQHHAHSTNNAHDSYGDARFDGLHGSEQGSSNNSPNFSVRQGTGQTPQQQHQQQQHYSGTDADDALPGVPSHLSALSREFVPSPLNHDMSDDSMRSVLLRQEVAAKILRMQSNQLQPPPGQSSNSSGNGHALSLASIQAQLDSLRSDNARLVERCSHYEREQSQLKLRLSEKERSMKQLQWSLENEQQEKSRLSLQLDTFNRFLSQPGLLAQAQAQAQAQGLSPNSSNSASAPLLAPVQVAHLGGASHTPQSAGTATPGNVEGKGEAAAAEVAESVLISPHDEEDALAAKSSSSNDSKSPQSASASASASSAAPAPASAPVATSPVAADVVPSSV